jgi:pullulanase/glycogen debranching enzyme
MNKVYEQMKLAVEDELKNHSGEIDADDIGKIADIVYNHLVKDGALNPSEDEDAFEAIMYLVTDLS